VADLIVTNVQHLDEMHGVKAYDRILAEHANGSSYEGASAFSSWGRPMNCDHPQCCICLKRECQQSAFQPRFKKYGMHYVCGESCITTAVSVAYEAARRLGW